MAGPDYPNFIQTIFMKVKALIALLTTMPQDLDVHPLDLRANADSDPHGEGSSVGIYSVTSVTHQGPKEIPEGTPEWVSIDFSSPSPDE